MKRTTNARLAGFMFLFYIASGLAEMAFLSPTRGAATTAAKLAAIAQHATMARFSAAVALLMMMNAIVLAVAIYALTRDYDRDLALLALVCRIAEGVLSAAGAGTGRALLTLATGGDTATATTVAAAIFSMRSLQTLLCATAFAIGSTIYCYLFLRARSIPRWMAWLGLIGSALLIVTLPLQIGGVFTGTPAMLVWIPIALFEVTFGVWLLIKGAA